MMNHLTDEKPKIEDKNYFKWIGVKLFCLDGSLIQRFQTLLIVKNLRPHARRCGKQPTKYTKKKEDD